MPHMANLSWLPLFILFNSVFIYFLSIFQSDSTKMFIKPSKYLYTTKKWQW